MNERYTEIDRCPFRTETREDVGGVKKTDFMECLKEKCPALRNLRGIHSAMKFARELAGEQE